jgi:hypothetical protein
MSPTEDLLWMVAVWVAITTGIAYFFSTWTTRVIFVAVAVAIPFWELPYGYYNLRKLCNEQGGLRVIEPIPPQRSICADHPSDSTAQAWLADGMDFVEARDKRGMVTKLTRGPKHSVTRSNADKILSEYCVTHAWINNLPWGIQRGEYVVTKATSQAIVARHSEFSWSGMSWQRAASPILGRGGHCKFREPSKAILQFVMGGGEK